MKDVIFKEEDVKGINEAYFLLENVIHNSDASFSMN